MDNTATKTNPAAKSRKPPAAAAVSTTDPAAEVEFARYITERGFIFDAYSAVREAPPSVRPLFARINLADDRIGPNLFCEPDALLANWATHECLLPEPKGPTDPGKAAEWRRTLTEEAIAETAAGLRAFLRNCKSKNNRLLGRVSKAYKDELRILTAYLADGAPAAPWNDYPEPPAAVPGWTNMARVMRELHADQDKRSGRGYFGRGAANEAPEMLFATWLLNTERSNEMRDLAPGLRRLLAELNLSDPWIASPLLRGNSKSLAALPPHLVFCPGRDDRYEGVNSEESRRFHTMGALREATKALRTFLQDCSFQC